MMSFGEGYTPVKAGDIVSPNPDAGAAARGPTFNWGSIMPFVVCILLTAITVTAALFFGQYETLLRGTPRGADDVSASHWPTVPQPTEKPQVVAHIREYTYDEDAPPGSHYHVPVPHHHHHHYDHYYTAVDNGHPLRFDCMASIDTWQRDWSNHKKQWCCTHDDPKFCAETTIDCTSHPSTWTKSQQEWCKWHDREHVHDSTDSKSQYYHGIRPFYAWPHHSTHHYADELVPSDSAAPAASLWARGDTILKAISNASACKRACHKAYHRIHAQVRKAPTCDGCSQASVDSVDDDRGLCEVQEVDEPSLLDGEQGSTDARQDSLGEHLFLSMWLVLLAF